jgi:hypothetical protein
LGERTISQVITPASDVLMNLSAGLMCLFVAISAMIFGKAVERTGGLFLAVSIGIHLISWLFIFALFDQIEVLNFILSIIDLIMFSVLALKTYRLWPILSSGSLFLISILRFLDLLGAEIGRFGNGRVLFVLWIAVPMLLLASLIRSVLRQRFGRDARIRRK